MITFVILVNINIILLVVTTTLGRLAYGNWCFQNSRFRFPTKGEYNEYMIHTFVLVYFHFIATIAANILYYIYGEQEFVIAAYIWASLPYIYIFTYTLVVGLFAAIALISDIPESIAEIKEYGIKIKHSGYYVHGFRG